MPSLRTFCVQFDRPSATYAPGENVSGNIIVDVAKEKNLRGLYFSATGKAQVQWTESAGPRQTIAQIARNELYNNTERYFNLKYTILSAQKSDARLDIPVGVHKYPFNFQLPYNIPSSFEHQFGKIRYTVNAVIERPWKFDHECKAAFTVIAPLDLNTQQDKCLPISDEIVKNFDRFYIKKGSLNMRVSMPVSGYVPGQSIDTLMEYENHSDSVKLTKISVRLMQILKFRSHTPSSHEKILACEIASSKNSGPFLAKGQLVTSIVIPSIPPSNLDYCSIIDVDYRLLIFFHISGLYCRIEKRYPLLIGTVPLYGPPSAPLLETKEPAPIMSNNEKINESGMVECTMPVSEKSGVPYSTTDSPMGDSLNNSGIPPPTYEECITGTENIMDVSESKYVFGAKDPFTPRYPVFNYPAPGANKN